MKKLVVTAIILMGLIFVNTQVQAQKTISYPFGAITTLSPVSHLTSALTISNQLTYVDYQTSDTVLTITVTTAAGVKAGAQLFIETTSNSTARSTIFSTGFLGVTVVGYANKTWLTSFIYDGTYWKCFSTIQIN